MQSLKKSERSLDGKVLKFDLTEPETQAIPRAAAPLNARGGGGGLKHSVFIGNLDFGVSEDQILEMCDGVLGAGQALKVRISIDRDSGE